MRNMRRFQWVRVGALVLPRSGLMLVLCACQAVAGGPFSQRAEVRGPRFEAVLINGGGKRSSNYLSHLLHVKEFNELLTRAGVPASHVTIFNADCENPGADLAVR